MSTDVTLLIQAYNGGDQAALDRLGQLLYPELKAMARRRTRGDGGLGATTLVNETFLKLLSGERLRSEDRQQFFGLAATVMRRVIVDEVRHAQAGKRDGLAVTYTESISAAGGGDDDIEFLLEVDRLVDALAAEDERLARVFECRYFAGFTVSETAECLGLSERSVERLWSDARSRIAASMSDSER